MVSQFNSSMSGKVAALVVAVISAVCASTTAAQDRPGQPVPSKLSAEDESPLEIPTLKAIPVTPLPSPEDQQKKIRTALDGEAAVRDGDPVLDDLLQLIRRKGSVLDGTILDPANESKLVDSEVIGPVVATQAENEDARALAAESLLRTARLLSSIGPVDSSRRELITRMRQEAAKLLAP